MDRKTFTIYQADSLASAKGGGMSLRNCRLELSGKIVQRPEYSQDLPVFVLYPS